jgi:hypothetical protein
VGNGILLIEECLSFMHFVRPLAIVGHGNVFNALAGFKMSNCEIKQYNGERPTPLLLANPSLG